MLNYVRAEFYKLLRRKYTYIALAGLLASEALFASMFAFHNSHSLPTFFGEAVVSLTELGAVGFCVCLLTGDIVFAGQYKNSTLKNEVSFGLSRARIYLGKLIAQTLLSIVYLVVMMGFFLGLCAVLLPHNLAGAYAGTVANDGYAMQVVGWFLTTGLPLWIGTQAACCMCLFLIQSDMVASLAYMGAIFALPTVVELVGLLAGGPVGRVLLQACQYFPGALLDNARAVVGCWGDMGKAWLVGAFWVAVCTAIGLYGFSKKEIK